MTDDELLALAESKGGSVGDFVARDEAKAEVRRRKAAKTRQSTPKFAAMTDDELVALQPQGMTAEETRAATGEMQRRVDALEGKIRWFKNAQSRLRSSEPATDARRPIDFLIEHIKEAGGLSPRNQRR